MTRLFSLIFKSVKRVQHGVIGVCAFWCVQLSSGSTERHSCYAKENWIFLHIYICFSNKANSSLLPT